MVEVSSPQSSTRKSGAVAIGVGGFAAGTLDLLRACIRFGWDIPLAIAAGLLGKKAFAGGAGTYVLGVFLHYFIACSAATLYYAASRRLTFLRDNPIVCGLFFGIAIFLVMNLVVLPLSAYHTSAPLQLASIRNGILIHMLFIGLPIALSVRRYSR